jgi:hypothetical protein
VTTDASPTADAERPLRRDAARNRKHARQTSRAAEEANAYMTDGELKALLAAIPTPEGPKLPPEAVVAGHFSQTLQPQKKHGKSVVSAEKSKVDAEEFNRAHGIDWSRYAGTKAARQV